MNARIKQLAIEAGMYVDLDGKPWPKWMGSEECEKAYERFAALIIEECARAGAGGCLGPTDRYHTAVRIRDHFQ
jgi:hypothetical protein